MDATPGSDTDDGGTGLAADRGVPVATTDLTDDVDLAWDRFVPERDGDQADLEVGGPADLEVEDPDTVAQDLELRWDVFESDARDVEDEEKSAHFEAVLERMTQRAQRHAEGGLLGDGDDAGAAHDVDIDDASDALLLIDIDHDHDEHAERDDEDTASLDDGDIASLDDEDIASLDDENAASLDEQIDAALARLEAVMNGDAAGNGTRTAAAPDEPYDWFDEEGRQRHMPALHVDAEDADAELDDALLHEAAAATREPEAIHAEFEEPESWLDDDDHADPHAVADDVTSAATARAHDGESTDHPLADALSAPATALSEPTWDDSWDDSWDDWDNEGWPDHEVAGAGPVGTDQQHDDPDHMAASSVLHGVALDDTELDDTELDDTELDDTVLDDTVLDDTVLDGGVDVPARSHRHLRPTAAGSDQRRLVLLAMLFFLVVLAAVVLHFGRTQSGGSSPTTPATSTSSSPAQLARLESAITDVQSASSGAQAELTTLTLFPTPPRVATVVNPYADALHLYETLASTVTVPSRARDAAQATQAQVRSDMAFLRTVNGLPPIQLGAFISEFLGRSTQLQQAMDTLQHALDPSAT